MVFANAYIQSMQNETLFTKHPYGESLKITCNNAYTTKYGDNGITLTCSSGGEWMLFLPDIRNSGNFVSQADLNDLCTAGEILL